MIKKKTNKPLLITLGVLCIVTFSVLGVNVYSYIRDRANIIRSGDTRMKAESAAAASEIDKRLRLVMASVDLLASDLSAGKISDKAALVKTKEFMATHPHIFDAGLAYVPFGRDPRTELYAPQYGYKDGKVRLFQLEDSVDYTKEDWFTRTLASGAGWLEPASGSAVKTLVTGYAVPFYKPGDTEAGKKPIGVVRATIALSEISNIASTFKSGKTGYGFILSREGSFIYHPIDDVVAKHKKIFDIMNERPGPDKDKMLVVVKKALSGESVSMERTNPATGQTSRIYYQPIRSSGWSFGTMFLTDEIFPDDGSFHKRQIWIILQVIIFLTLLLSLVFRVDTLRIVSLWIVAIIFSLLCLAGTLYIWRLEIMAPLSTDKDTIMIADQAVLNKFTAGYSRSLAEMGKTPPLWIPAGIYVQSIEFSSANDIDVSGYAWQTYADGIHDGLIRAFILPEAQKFSSTEIYRVKEDGSEIVGWRFEATIREKIDYSKYPFDRPSIGIWLKHADFQHDAMLVPDLDSYKFLTSVSRPGLQAGLALPGYSFMGSFFNYNTKVCNTNFGIAEHKKFGAYPELYYTIIVKRNFITPFLSRIFPLIILLSILFIVLLTFSKDEEKKKAFGMNGLAVMGVVITFLFTTLIAQGSLRQELGAGKIIYLESFYFITYFVLLLVAIKTFLFTGNKNIPIIQYEHGLVAKLLYWPIVMALVLLSSVIHFY